MLSRLRCFSSHKWAVHTQPVVRHEHWMQARSVVMRVFRVGVVGGMWLPMGNRIVSRCEGLTRATRIAVDMFWRVDVFIFAASSQRRFGIGAWCGIPSSPCAPSFATGMRGIPLSGFALHCGGRAGFEGDTQRKAFYAARGRLRRLQRKGFVVAHQACACSVCMACGLASGLAGLQRPVSFALVGSWRRRAVSSTWQRVAA